MAAKDHNGNTIGLGDVLIVTVESVGKRVVTIVKISETMRGVSATGAYVDHLVGNGRVAKVPVDVKAATLVLRADGSEVKP